MALNDKEKCFANEYIINRGNAYQAALQAGYAPNTAKVAYQWLEEPKGDSTANRNLPFKPELKQYISDRVSEMESEKIATATEVMQYLTSVMRGEAESELVLVTRNGDGSMTENRINKKPDEKEKLKAADSLAKILGIVNEKVNVTGSLPIVIVDDVGEE